MKLKVTWFILSFLSLLYSPAFYPNWNWSQRLEGINCLTQLLFNSSVHKHIHASLMGYCSSSVSASAVLSGNIVYSIFFLLTFLPLFNWLIRERLTDYIRTYHRYVQLDVLSSFLVLLSLSLPSFWAGVTCFTSSGSSVFSSSSHENCIC